MGLTTFLAMIFGCSETKKEPEWTKSRVLAEKLDHPLAITTDDKNIYYVTGGTIASLKEGTSGVWKMPLAGGEPVQLFKGSQKDEKTVILPDTYVLATDEKYLYFSAGYIYRVPKDGGEAEQITPGNPTEMVVDQENIYWHNYVGEGMSPVPINMVAKKGGTPQVITDQVNVTGFAIDRDFFYFSTPDGVYKISKKDKTQTKIYSIEKGQIRELAADADYIYAEHWQDPKTQIVKISKKDNSANPLGQPIYINTTQSLKIDDLNLYFLIEKSTFGDALAKMSKTDGTLTEIDNGYLASFTVGKDKIYLTDIVKIYELAK
jgi:hypothetical protein